MADDKFVDEGHGLRWSGICHSCRWWSQEGPTCAAFTEQIPWEILDGRVDHRQPHPDDGGYQYEPIDPTQTDPHLPVDMTRTIA